MALGQCVVGGKTELAARCANGWRGLERASYAAWRVDESSDFRLSAGMASEIHVTGVSARNDLVRVGIDTATGSHTMWLNADALACGARNVTTYAQPFETHAAGSDGCGRDHTLPIAPSAARAADAITDAQASQVLAQARHHFDCTQQNADFDMVTLQDAYETMSDRELFDTFSKAEAEMSRQHHRLARIYDADCERELPRSVPEIERVQGQRTCRLARETLALARSLLGERQSTGESGDESPERIGARIRAKLHDFKRSRELTGYDDLTLRMALFHGLPATRQRELQSKLHFARLAVEPRFLEKHLKLELGKTFVELHNGYVYGGAGGNKYDGGGIDCSHFIAELFSLRSGKAASTYHLQQISRYLEEGRQKSLKPPPPWSDYADCFTAVNLRKGDPPRAADLVVSRDLHTGHVVVVESYDEKKGTVKTFEAAGGGAGGDLDTVGRNERPLFEPACANGAMRPVRAGLSVLRYKGGGKCPIKWNAVPEKKKRGDLCS